MKRIIISGLTCVVALVSLSGCIPAVPEMHYEYIPAASYRGKECVYQCDKTYRQCVWGIRVRQRECLNMAMTEAKFQYQSYVFDRKLKHLPVTRHLMSFYRPQFCQNYMMCDTQVKTCQVMCGQNLYYGHHYVDFMKDGNYCHPQQWPNGHCLAEPTH